MGEFEKLMEDLWTVGELSDVEGGSLNGKLMRDVRNRGVSKNIVIGEVGRIWCDCELALSMSLNVNVCVLKAGDCFR